MLKSSNSPLEIIMNKDSAPPPVVPPPRRWPFGYAGRQVC